MIETSSVEQDVLELPAPLRDRIIQHARLVCPEECCGLLFGRGSRVEQIMWMENIEHSALNYRVSDRAFLVTEDAMSRAGLDLIGFYHSHTHSPASPSRTDINYAARGYPDFFQVIVSLANPDEPVLRAYTIGKDETVKEVAIR
ncbi:MAG TPA: M67 family metallopeptidase [Chloroflexota bacterium]|nr:M67 family metallopeptidase [Chloroflexota bacterium]